LLGAIDAPVVKVRNPARRRSNYQPWWATEISRQNRLNRPDRFGMAAEPVASSARHGAHSGTVA
jgi:hypothetical protein